MAAAGADEYNNCPLKDASLSSSWGSRGCRGVTAPPGLPGRAGRDSLFFPSSALLTRRRCFTSERATRVDPEAIGKEDLPSPQRQQGPPLLAVRAGGTNLPAAVSAAVPCVYITLLSAYCC